MDKILIIDDEKNIQVSLASILEDEGYKVYFASTGEEGFEKFLNLRPEIIFLDIWLPGIDGLETMKKNIGCRPLPGDRHDIGTWKYFDRCPGGQGRRIRFSRKTPEP